MRADTSGRVATRCQLPRPLTSPPPDASCCVLAVVQSLCSNARVLLMDEISTGLDSAVTFDIVSGIRAWAKATRGTVVIALLQPTPEVFALFDDVIMLREGSVIYHGPRAELGRYASSIGFQPPTTTGPVAVGATKAERAISAAEAPGGEGAVNMDMADWLVEMLANPAATWRKGQAAGASKAPKLALPAAAVSAAATAAPSPTPAAPDAVAVGVGSFATIVGSEAGSAVWAAEGRAPFTTPELAAAWQAYEPRSAWHTPSVGKDKGTPPLALNTPFAQAQYGRPYPRTALHHFNALLLRQWRLLSRNSLMVIFRIVSSVVMALILGSTFYQIPDEKSIDKVSCGAGAAGRNGSADDAIPACAVQFGMLLFGAIHVAFTNFSEVSRWIVLRGRTCVSGSSTPTSLPRSQVPAAVEAKYTVYKHLSAGEAWVPR